MGSFTRKSSNTQSSALKQKDELFAKVRSGEVRILLGSTAKMGTGTNETYTSATKNLLREKSEKSGCQEGKAGEMFEYYSYESSPGLSKLCHQLQSFCGLC